MTVVVEGKTDVPVAARLLEFAGLVVGPVHVSRGKDRLDSRLAGYNAAAQRAEWLVLRDLDHDAECGPELARRLLPRPSAGMRLRIAVREVEAWLMADHAAISAFLGVERRMIPTHTERLDDPKRLLVQIARRSRNRAIRDDMVPAERTSARVGPGYSGRIIDFAQNHWRPRVAARRNPSLAKCIVALRRWARA
ncbi:MAG: hypothetical protein QME96_03845 [Myxococcota bacterium]|nr:hypothetical protein [Myxococcota bacterium]